MTATVYGLELNDLPENMTPLRAVVIVEGVDLNDGDSMLAHRTTDGLCGWHVLGMCDSVADTVRNAMREE